LGLPRPAIAYDLSQYTKDGLIAARQASSQIIAAMHATEFTTPPDDKDPSTFTATIGGKDTRIKYFGSGHIAGTHGMGTDKRQSVVDSTDIYYGIPANVTPA